MKDKGLDKISYLILSHQPWIPGADVTMLGIVFRDIIPIECELANDAIIKMIEDSRD